MKLQIVRMDNHGGRTPQLLLATEGGEVLPCQLAAKLEMGANSLTTLSVTFVVDQEGLLWPDASAMPAARGQA